MASIFCPVCALAQESIAGMLNHVSVFHFLGEANGASEVLRRLNNQGFGLPPDYFDEQKDFIKLP